jgi:adenylate cyclase
MVLVCQQCEAENPPWFCFCGRCGAPLPAACPACGTTVPPGFRFCGYCGKPLPPAAPGDPAREPSQTRDYGAPETPQASQAPTANRQPATVIRPLSPISDAERGAGAGGSEQRRRVAILFADLVGSTALAERVDTELAYRVVSGCLQGLGAIVTQAGGYVVKLTGDGLMALFGAPTAHGDDATRAGRAALRMQLWMAEYGGQIQDRYGIDLCMRVGINYGSVVAASMAAGTHIQYDVVGDAANVAQRIESAAEPRTVCVSEAFYRISRPAFEYCELGAAQLKGKREPMALFQLVRERDTAPAETGLPLIGREAEMEALRAAAQRLRSGRGGLLSLAGDLGMGKTRLLEELAQELVALGIPCLRARAPERAREAPLALWQSWLRRLLPVEAGMSHAEAAAQIRSALGTPDRSAWAEWLAALAVEPQRLMTLDPEARAATTRGALLVFLEHWRQQRPAALVVDDADQLDALSLQLLEDASRGMPDLLVALAGREIAVPAAERLRLEPLPPGTAPGWLSRLLPEMEVAPKLERRLIEQAGGSPLFLELLVRAIREGGSPASVVDNVPDSLYALLQARVDALPESDRRVLCLAAVLGKIFAEHWLASLCEVETDPEPGSSAPWGNLETDGLLVEQRPPPQRELAFRHGALQEVVEEGILPTPRQQVHARAAGIIAADAASHPELAARVAWHWKRAGTWNEALTWSLRAAEQAALLYAGEEATELYRDALEIAMRLGLPGPAARAVAGLGDMAAHQGQFAPALEHYREAERYLDEEEEASPAGEGAVLLRTAVLRGHARVRSLTGSPAAAVPLLERALQLLEKAIACSEDRASGETAHPEPPTIRTPGHREGGALLEYVRCLNVQAQTLRDLGRLEDAAAAARRAMELAEPRNWRSETSSASTELGEVYRLLGRASDAERELRRAAGIADECNDWQNAAACWIDLGLVLQSLGRFHEAIEALERAAELADRIGDAAKIVTVRADLGIAQLNRGHWAAAEAEFRATLAQFRSMGHHLGVCASLGNLAGVLLWTGRIAEAEAALAEAESCERQTETPHLRAYLTTVRAELALAQGRYPRAVQLATEAIELAQASGHSNGVNSGRLALGRALRLLGDLQASAQELQTAGEGFAAAGERLDQARARAELAAVAAAQGNVHRARELHRDAAEAIRQLGADPWLERLPALAA